MVIDYIMVVGEVLLGQRGITEKSFDKLIQWYENDPTDPLAEHEVDTLLEVNN